MQQSHDNTQLAFRALADTSRREILMLLSSQDLTIGEVAQHFTMTRAAVKKHLTILEEGNLISIYPKGRERYNHLEPDALQATSQWFSYFSQFWDDNLSNLKSAVEKDVQ